MCECCQYIHMKREASLYHFSFFLFLSIYKTSIHLDSHLFNRREREKRTFQPGAGTFMLELAINRVPTGTRERRTAAAAAAAVVPCLSRKMMMMMVKLPLFPLTHSPLSSSREY